FGRPEWSFPLSPKKPKSEPSTTLTLRVARNSLKGVFSMPTYEYQCDACDHSFEEFQSMKDDPLIDCPSCGKPKLRRLFGSGAAIIFKGSRFYQTDYRSESYKSAAKADREGSKGSSSNGTNGKNDPSPPAKKEGSNSSSEKSSKV